MQYAKLSPNQLSVVEIVSFDTLPPSKAGRIRPLVVDSVPAFDAATQKAVNNGYVIEPAQVRQTWQVVSLTQAELDVISDAAEHDAVVATRAQLALDIDESIADQAEAQAFIDLNGATTAADRNTEIRNAALRDKRRLQRERRQTRALRMLLKQA
jgi:hypothetical protein